VAEAETKSAEEPSKDQLVETETATTDQPVEKEAVAAQVHKKILQPGAYPTIF
jgi:hypothetical protein